MKKSELKKIKDFHGHIGPYAVTGYLIGQLAKKSFKKVDKIIVYNPLRTPQSCVIDGLQLSSGCSLGRSNIILIKSKSVKIEIYSRNKSAVVKLDDDFQKKARRNFGKNMSTFAKNIEPLIYQFF